VLLASHVQLLVYLLELGLSSFKDSLLSAVPGLLPLLRLARSLMLRRVALALREVVDELSLQSLLYSLGQLLRYLLLLLHADYCIGRKSGVVTVNLVLSHIDWLLTHINSSKRKIFRFIQD
jgi:hypothetical protein